MKYILKFLPRKFLIKYSFLVTPILRIIYKGKKYTDPIDESNYSRFLSYGYKKIRKNALCPGTLSLERHRLLWLYLEKETNFLNSSCSSPTSLARGFRGSSDWTPPRSTTRNSCATSPIFCSISRDRTRQRPYDPG